MAMDYLNKILGAFEVLSATEIRDCFEHGVDPNAMHEGKALIYTFINYYLRGPEFSACVQAFVDYGLKFEDDIFLAVLLNDGDRLDLLLLADPQALHKTYTLDCTFTPLYQASLLHICAEYNLLHSAKVLVKHGMDINVKAGIDEHGFGAQSSIFHTVNQHANSCIDMLRYLLSQSADLDLTVKGLNWGKGYEWETFIPSVNPISYAMMGLLRQFQRKEKDIYEVVALLMHARYGIDYVPSNIPNAYLNN